MRYEAAGAIDEHKADAFFLWAELAIDSVLQMMLDGVL